MILQQPHLYGADFIIDVIKPSCGRVWYKLVDDVAPRKWKRNISAFDPNLRFRKYQQRGDVERKSRPRSAKRRRDHSRIESSLFQYSPLPSAKSVRLVRLFPGDDESPISGEIVLTTLEENTPFEALSYTWGNPTSVSSICLGESQLPLTENLEVALKQLRYSNISRMVWIDALCIDQENMDERQSQVLLMGQIYSSASAVIVWLGADVPVSDSTFELIRILSEAALQPGFAESYPLFLTQAESFGIPLGNVSDWITLDRLFWSAWFTRVWVIQEIVLARRANVYFGSYCISWPEFNRAASCASSMAMAGWEAIFPGRVQALYRLSNELRDSSKPDLLSLLRITRLSYATDPRDHVYALLGLVSSQNLDPDYSSSICHVFMNTAKQFLVRTGYSFLSAVVDSKRTQVPGLPSWVPDWGTPPKASDLLDHMSKRKPTASGETIPCFQVLEPNMLLVSGAIVDSIAHMAPILYVWDSPVFIAQGLGQETKIEMSEIGTEIRLRSWERLALGLKSYPNGTEVAEAYHRTLNQDQEINNADNDAITIHNSYAIFRSRWLRRMENGLGYKEPDAYKLPNFNTSTAAVSYEQQLWDVCGQRRLIITRKGYLGLVPASTRHGDKIAIFLGGSTPYVLRENWGSTYMFRGDCYIHGIMYGESLQKEHKIQDLILR